MKFFVREDKLGFVGIAEGFPLGGSWHGGAVTDEGAGLGQLSFIATSPQGEGFGAVQTIKGFPSGGSCHRR